MPDSIVKRITTLPLFSIGFRPFYFGASLFASLAVPFWLLLYQTGATTDGQWQPYAWHAHEMLFGFAPAVIIGFLLTAARNWTGLPTPSAAPLAALFALWIAGRLAALLGFIGAYGLLAAITELAFLPVATVVIAVPLVRSRNVRNYFVIAILSLLSLANIGYTGLQLGWFGGVALPSATSIALDLLALLLTVIGGRVIPAFSGNAIRGLQPKHWPLIEAATITAMCAVLLADLGALWLGADSAVQPWLLLLAAGLQLTRIAGWQPWRTLSNPLLLVLPLSYLWIPIHLLLRWALGGGPGVIPSAAVHALLIGAMAGLMLSMMTRSALGHTGRPLIARAPELICFAAIQSAALVRVFGPLVWPADYLFWIGSTAVLWTLAFATFFIAYLGILTRPRLT